MQNMKFNSLLSVILGIFLVSCDDDLTNIGSSIRPETDNLVVKSATFTLASSTFVPEAIYVRTSTPLLGELNDNFYGAVRTDYMAQLYARPGFDFNAVNSKDSVIYDMSNPLDSMINNSLDSAVLRIYYDKYFGDSLTPMVVSAYKVQNQLPRDFYSNVDFTPYVEPLELLGSNGYTGKDMTVSDSLRGTSDYTPYVDIKLIDEVKDSFLDKVKNDPSVFDNQSSFEQFFPGVYLKNTFGNGTMLRVVNTYIVFFYRSYHDRKVDGTPLTGSAGQDSSYITNHSKYIGVTPDVIQLNSVKNPLQVNPDFLTNDSSTYVTAPGGYFSQIDIPVKEVMEELNKNTTATAKYLNGLTLSVRAYKPVDNVFSATPPPYMLLVQKNKMNEFFEKNSLPDSKTSFIAAYSSDTVNNVYTYNFGNLNQLAISLADSVDLAEMAVVPVNATIDQTYGSILQVANYFYPSAVTLRSGKNAQIAKMVYTLQMPK
ncbi:MAG: DUF4270 domain-containing protein [Bacteroidales bacterium]|nr:DUF4270 domain-containing protein [Bacteroidales bacterium]